MKRTKEEILAALSQHQETLGAAGLSLMEDVADSFETVDLSGYVTKPEYDKVVQAYKDRFTGKVDTSTPFEKELDKATTQKAAEEEWTIERILGRK
jgi:hypothetical protein